MCHVQNLRYCVLLLLLLFCLNNRANKYKRKTVNGASFTSIKLVFASTENVYSNYKSWLSGLWTVLCVLCSHVFPVTRFSLMLIV